MTSAAALSDCPSWDTTHVTWKSSESFSPLSVHEPPWARRALTIPRADETLFARPELAATPDGARANHELLSQASVDLQGRPLAELRQSARREILEAAQRYTADLLGEPAALASAEELLFCSGHQPSLYHPGVWVKNFALGAMAAHTGGTALNLVIDNDVLSSRQLRVPTGDRNHPTTDRLAFDDPSPKQPWEEAVIANAELFESFGPRVEEAMARWNVTPLLTDLWPVAVAQSRRSPKLRDAFTAARATQERRWGLANLELPLSRLCETESFHWFAASLLARLPRFWEIHNVVLAEYRAVNRIRSRTHPVPELAEQDGWFEAPFWVWRDGQHRRGRVMAKACSREVRLSDGQEIFARLPLSPEGEIHQAVEVLKDLPRRGIRFRTRALSTTLFARLCLADLFVHGIGGAKYDEMTDRLIARFFGLPAPGFLTLSCTVHLPLGTPFDVTQADELRVRQQLRDLDYNADRHLAPGTNPALDALISQKQSLMAEQRAAQPPGLGSAERRRQRRENYDRYREFQDVNRQLAALATSERHLLEAELKTLQEHQAANSLLKDREFSFGLYPEEKLRPFFTHVQNRVSP